MKRPYPFLRLFSVITALFFGLSAFAGEPAKVASSPQQAKPAADAKTAATTPIDNVVLAPVAVAAPDKDGNLIIAYTHLTREAAVAKFNGADVDAQGKRLPAGFNYSLADASTTQALLESRAAEIAQGAKLVQNGRTRLEYAAVKRSPIPTKTAAATQTAPPAKPADGQ